MNAVIYARYSSNAQNEQSIEGQLHDCYAYAERMDIKIIGEYIDRAITGKSDDRPEFQRMISDAKKKCFDRIIVWKFDRFARNRYDQVIYKSQLKKNNVRVISAMENVGEGDESVLLEAMLEALAEYYSLDLQKKILRGLRETIAKKKYPGGPVAYGYKVVDQHLCIDEEKAQIIRYVFEQYANGTPMKDIVKELNDRGVRSSSGGKLTQTTFTRAIQNPCYIGLFKFNGELIEGIADPMIPKEIFDAANERAKQNKRQAAAQHATVDYLLSGKLFCGHCGNAMTGAYGKGKSGGIYYYYECVGKKRHAVQCDKHRERKVELQNYVISQTLKYVLNEQNIKRISSAIVSEYNKEFDHCKIDSLERKIAKIDRDLNKLVDTLIDAPKVAHQRIYDKMEQLQSQKSVTQDDLAKLRIASAVTITEREVEQWLLSFCAGDPEDEAFRHNIIDAFVNSVYVYDDRIVIFYNIKNTTTPSVPYESVTDSVKSSSTTTNEFDYQSNSSTIRLSSQTQIIFMHRVFGIIVKYENGHC